MFLMFSMILLLVIPIKMLSDPLIVLAERQKLKILDFTISGIVLLHIL